MRRLVLSLLVLASCSKASPEAEKKRWQEPPPPPEVSVPAGLSIAVEVNGAAKPPITTATLQHTKPDFVDVDHRAWRIPTLVADAAAAGTVVEAASPTGVAVKFANPTSDGLEPALFLTRRGDVMVGALDPKEPFPRYHGQGGRQRRSGDSMPRVSPVSRLAITTK
jgi:hypothetical protein